mmetsp:Transcript_63861/g.73233  ORF Transcript_63861/g.73233 Transcript_63861/m.73233 type:complete len:108 (-) Transcript_63861:177-500(-)|eukprot:CAMPEP_0115040250 /NCGR_PEP_ID=MMETSP0216-20121206/44673_1 /TAXON_ID=223996 /ORGANISM="Protocruzia adherens, Strain Boccale" /LENGTH=107 /DNA_ID=CAMNT_0002421367 /DNA_START=345 /DNA_END=668 /DNA_ORIENTATION=-
MAICDAKQQNASLRNFNVSGCSIDDEAGSKLAELIKTCDTLEHLSLKDNHLGDETAGKFVEALAATESLMSVFLLGNAMSQPLKDSIQDIADERLISCDLMGIDRLP